MNATDVPPTEPSAPTESRAPAAPSERVIAVPTNVIPAAECVADVTTTEDAALHWYWVGLLPGAPRLSIDLAGVSFPLRNEEVSNNGHGKTIRRPGAGVLIKLSEPQLHRIAEAVRHKVIRFREFPSDEIPGTVDMAKKVARELPDAVILRIPTAKEVEKAKANAVGHRPSMQPYVASSADRPVADFVYMQYLPEVEPRARQITAELPPPISKTGIPLPPEGARRVPLNEMAHKGDPATGLTQR